MEQRAIEGESPVGEAYHSFSNFVQSNKLYLYIRQALTVRIRKLKSKTILLNCLKKGGPPSNPKTLALTDSEQVP